MGEDTTVTLSLNASVLGEISASIDIYEQNIDSSLFTFHISDYSHDFSPAPSDSTTVSSPGEALVWEDCAVGDSYQLQISGTEDFSSTLYDSELSEAKYILGSALESYNNYSDYWWRLRWKGSDYDWSDWSDSISFNTDYLYSVSYDGNGAESGSAPVDVTEYHEGNSVFIPGNSGTDSEGTEDPLIRAGYIFKGWSTNPDSSTVDYGEGAEYGSVSGDTVFYAVWKKEVTITFNANGGAGSMSAVTGAEGDTIILPECSYTKTYDAGIFGYQDYFSMGWSRNNYEIQYLPGDEISLNSDYTLYPYWLEEIQSDDYGGFYHVMYDQIGTLKIESYLCYLSSPESYKFSIELSDFPVTSIGKGSYDFSSNTTNIEISGIERIESGAFSGNTSIQQVNISVDDIGDEAFMNCTELNHLYGNAGSIGNNAFYGCSSLDYVDLYSYSESVGESAFEGCPVLSTVFFRAGVGSIGDRTFWGNENLSTVLFCDPTIYDFTNNELTGEMPSTNCTSIGEDAFWDTDITYIILPETLQFLKDGAFGNLMGLTVSMLGSNAPGFEGVPFTTFGGLEGFEDETLRIEVSALEPYMYDPDWNSLYAGYIFDSWGNSF